MSSVITVTTNNNLTSLNTFLEAISRGSTMPREVIVIDLSGRVEIIKEYSFMIKVQPLTGLSGFSPMAVARNTGTRQAWEDDLIFLDVNCIPNSNFIEKMEDQLLCASGLIMGEPRLLKLPGLSLRNDKDLFEQSVYHPERPDLKKELTPCYDARTFWGMGFGMHKKEFEEVGGFDENYKTTENFAELDFVNKLFEKKKDFYLSQNTYYHISELRSDSSTSDESFIHDCNLFHRKWGVWPMQDVLQEYTNTGLINWTANLKTNIELLDNSEPEKAVTNAQSKLEVVSHRA